MNKDKMYNKTNFIFNSRTVFISTLIFTLLLLWAFFFKMIPPGYIGITVNLFGEDKGMSTRELGVGMHWIAPWKTVYKFPMFERNEIWEGKDAFTFQTGDGLNVTADMGISFHLEPGKVHTLFGKYRKGIDEITHIFLHNSVRDSVNKTASRMKIEDLYGTEKQHFVEAIQSEIKSLLEPIGISVDRVYLIGTLHFPQPVVLALNSKIEATQRAQQRENELREAKAQAEKDMACAHGRAQAILITANCQAEANLTIASSLTKELIMYEAIKKWDGAVPKMMGTSIETLVPLDIK